MNISSKKRILILCAHLAPVVSGLAGFATPVGAQNAAAPAVSQSVSQSDSSAASATQGAYSVTDEDLRERVQAALHSDPYFYDEHVTVSVENGVVVLHGFVSSEWDLRDAIRIATRAADARRVIDDLSIELGGRR
jgi:osmotically-inducible protein OsmY